MLTSQVVEQGEHEVETYPQVKQWQHYNTFALFSSEGDAVIIAADEAHENDFVGMKVLDTSSSEWVKVKSFEITIKGD